MAWQQGAGGNERDMHRTDGPMDGRIESLRALTRGYVATLARVVRVRGGGVRAGRGSHVAIPALALDLDRPGTGKGQ